MPFADAQANARRRSRSESVQTGSHQSQPIAVENRAVTHAPVLRRASERAKSRLARARGKSIPLRKLERQRAAPASERCSYAVLECRFYTRFAVTNQLKNAAGVA
jgi:hypothetical protein